MLIINYKDISIRKKIEIRLMNLIKYKMKVKKGF